MSKREDLIEEFQKQRKNIVNKIDEIIADLNENKEVIKKLEELEKESK